MGHARRNGPRRGGRIRGSLGWSSEIGASTPVTTHSVIVCTVPTASADPAIAAASTHRLARVIGLDAALPSLPMVLIARLGEYFRLSVAADLPGCPGYP